MWGWDAHASERQSAVSLSGYPLLVLLLRVEGDQHHTTVSLDLALM